MKKFINIYFVGVILLTILGGFLRFYKMTVNPPELNIDEVALGYNAYSILKTGRDEYGTFMPITFKSVGDYKSPIPVYILVPSIAVFGLTEFAVRFPSAFLGTIAIPFYYLLFNRLFKNRFASLAATTLYAISPWSLYYSRYHYEHHYTVLLMSVGLYFFDKFKEEGGKIKAFLSAFFFASTIYSYIAERLFLPLFLLGIILINRGKLLKVRRETVVFLLSVVLFALPMFIRTFWGNDSARAGMVFLTQDIDYTRYGILDNNYTLPQILHPVYNFIIALTFWFRRFLAYFEGSFLYFTGLGMTTEGSLGLGVTYLFELPLLLTGAYLLIKNKIQNRSLLIMWLLLGIFPASLTNNEQSPGRSLLILPVLAMLAGFGFWYLSTNIKKIRNRIIKYSLITSFLLLVFWQLGKAILIFAVHFPIQKGEGFMDVMKEVITYAIEHQNEYDEIIIDPYRGIEAPNVVGIPHMYYLFYSKYDPQKYQTIEKVKEGEYYHFDKITIRKVYWPADRNTKNVLFIASPWSIIPKEVGNNKIVKEAFVRNHQLALIVVSTK